MKIILIRHGITEGNLLKRFNGSKTDEPLSQKGIEALKAIEYPKADYLFVSPMKRCIETARIIFPNISGNIVEDLREIDFGIFEGKSHNDLKDNIHYKSWIDSEGLGNIPEGESFNDFCKRCKAAFLKAIENIDEYKNAAFVVHGGTIMALLSSLGGYNYFNVIAENGKGYVCNFENSVLTIDYKI